MSLRRTIHWITQLVIFTAYVLASTALVAALMVRIYEWRYQDRIYPGVTVWGLDLGGLGLNEAMALLDHRFNPYRGDQLTLRHDEQSWQVSPSDLGVSLDVAATAVSAHAVGRGATLWDSLQEQAQALRHGHEVEPILKFDTGVAMVFLSQLAREVNRPVRNADLTVDGLQVEVTSSQVGWDVDLAATYQLLHERIAGFSGGEVGLVVQEKPPLIADVSEVQALVETMISSPLVLSPNFEAQGELVGGLEPWTLSRETISNMLIIRQVKEDDSKARLEAELDQEKLGAYIEGLARQIERSPRNARFDFDDSSGGLTPIVRSREGRALDTAETMRLINTQVATADREITLPILAVRPQVADDDGPNLGIVELVSEGITYFKGSSAGRVHNIQVAASKFHGLVIPPGQTFSFNEHLGEVSAETGYEESVIISGDRTTEGIGGGICQVSTTAFRAAFWGGFPILERSPHSFRVSWYEPPIGLDATVFAPAVDLKFLNDTPYHVLIETEADTQTGALAFRFYSTKTGRTVEMEGPIEENVVPHGPPVYEDDPTLPKGTTRQVEWARDGVDVTIYRIIKEGEAVISREKFFSRYRPWTAVYLVGTKE
ncbi:MAG: VanW family protein [Anaerolineales bacterium]|nr:VanW family protein [Anaerolineales bacterium]